MNKKFYIYVSWLLVQIILIVSGVFISYFSQVANSMTGLNPYGIVSFGIAMVVAIGVFKIGVYKGIHPYHQ
tara:strand:+ start:103 stop:315 length:213 start_codon:yes stop_codon:yes gene_type:complete